MGTEVEKEIFLHHEKKSATSEDGKTEKSFCLINDMFDFENVAFSRNVDPTFKYLTCADCEIPIIGIQYLTGAEEKKIYICKERLSTTKGQQ